MSKLLQDMIDKGLVEVSTDAKHKMAMLLMLLNVNIEPYHANWSEYRRYQRLDSTRVRSLDAGTNEYLFSWETNNKN